MKTNMIYQQDVYTRTCSATVENVILKDDHAEIVLDQTIFELQCTLFFRH